MQIKTVFELIEWTRALHGHLAQCLADCASGHPDERASSLLAYLATHEAEMEIKVTTFNRQADPKATHTYVYDYIPHNIMSAHQVCDDLSAHRDIDAIRAAVFDFHRQINDLFRTLLSTAVIPEATDLLQALHDMEQNEARRLARQIGRMDDL